MTNKKVDLETSLVAQELWDRLLRVDPYALDCQFSPAAERSVEYVTELTNAVINIGVFTPVLVDENDIVVAGHGLVDAATRIGLEDIPAIRIEGLSAEEWEIYTKSMARFFSLGEVPFETFLSEARPIMELKAIYDVANDNNDGTDELTAA